MQLGKEKFKEKLESGEYMLLDVRTQQERIIYGVIDENDIHIDIYQSDAIEKIQKLPKEGKYLIYCFHGNRSYYVVSIMKELGFTEMYDLEGGIAHFNSL